MILLDVDAMISQNHLLEKNNCLVGYTFSGCTLERYIADYTYNALLKVAVKLY